MMEIGFKHRVVTVAGPVWSGHFYRCSTCSASIITDWNHNADSYDTLSPPALQKLRREFFPYIFKER